MLKNPGRSHRGDCALGQEISDIGQNFQKILFFSSISAPNPPFLYAFPACFVKNPGQKLNPHFFEDLIKMFANDHKILTPADSEMSVTVCVLFTKNALYTQEGWLVGPISNSATWFRPMSEVLLKVVSIFCTQHEITESRLDVSVTEMVRCGEAALRLSISRNFFESQDLFADQIDFIGKFNKFLERAIEGNNQLSIVKDLFSEDKNLSEVDDHTAVAEAANAIITRSRKLPRELTICSVDEQKPDSAVKYNTVVLHAHPPSMNTLSSQIQRDEKVILTGFDFEKRVLFCRTDKDIRYSLTIEDDEIGKLRHLVDGQSFRKIRIKGMSHNPDSDQPSVANPVFVQLLSPVL